MKKKKVLESIRNQELRWVKDQVRVAIKNKGVMSVVRGIWKLVGERASHVSSVARKGITRVDAKVNLQKAKRDQYK